MIEYRNVPVRAKLKSGAFGIVELTESEYRAWADAGKPEDIYQFIRPSETVTNAWLVVALQQFKMECEKNGCKLLNADIAMLGIPRDDMINLGDASLYVYAVKGSARETDGTTTET